MAVDLPRDGRYMPAALRHDWAKMRERLVAEPGEWVIALDREVSNGSVSWLRRTGPLALREIKDEIEYRLRDTHALEGVTTRVGTLYAKWTPGQTAEPYKAGVLTDDQVVEVREAYAAGGVSQQTLAEKYGMSLSGMNSLLHGKVRVAAGGPLIEGDAR
jgi:hypothetical protein